MPFEEKKFISGYAAAMGLYVLSTRTLPVYALVLAFTKVSVLQIILILSEYIFVCLGSMTVFAYFSDRKYISVLLAAAGIAMCFLLPLDPVSAVVYLTASLLLMFWLIHTDPYRFMRSDSGKQPKIRSSRSGRFLVARYIFRYLMSNRSYLISPLIITVFICFLVVSMKTMNFNDGVLIGIALSIGIGIVAAFILHFKIPVLSQIVKVYVELFRNTPLLVQLFFIYFGLPKIGLSISAEVCGAVGLGLLGGSYMAESFRSGLEAVPLSQTESALALGMNRLQMFGSVILPQAFSISVPAIVANIIFLLKETSVFSAISLMDLMFTAKDLIGQYYNTTECLVMLVGFYIVMLLPVSILGSLVEHKARYRMFGD